MHTIKTKITSFSIGLAVILLLSAGLRLYNLGTNPPHLTPDEASLGYNAYSLLKTGKDEHGQVFPIVFKSFGDYKPGLYVYATIPSVAVLGLNEFSVRLPSAIMGIMGVLLLYLIARELYPKNSRFPLFAAFFLAISPWHIHFSRGAWEINLSLTLTLAGVYCFLRATKNPKWLYLSATFFAATLLAYQGAKLSTSIVVLILSCVYRKQLFTISKARLGKAILIGLIISSPIIMSVFTGKAGRLSVFSVFSYPRPSEYLQATLDQGNEQVGTVQYYIFHSEAFNFLRGIFGRWFNHFSGRFLFFEGDWSNPRHSAPYQGMLTVFDLPLLVIGAWYAFKSKVTKESLFIFAWLFLAPLPAVLSRDAVHAVRSFNMVIPMTLLVAAGADTLFKLTKRWLLVAGLIGVYLFGYCYFLNMYFVHMPKQNSKYWEYGYKQIVQSLIPVMSNYEHIVFQQSYAQPYIYFLFYGAEAGDARFMPKSYQSVSSTTFIESKYGDVGQVSGLENISFTGIDWQVLRGKTGTLVVGDAIRIPPGDSQEGTEFHVVKEVKYLNNRDFAFRVIEIK